MFKCKAKALKRTDEFRRELSRFAEPRLSIGCAFRYVIRYTNEEDGTVASGSKANIPSSVKLVRVFPLVCRLPSTAGLEPSTKQFNNLIKAEDYLFILQKLANRQH